MDLPRTAVSGKHDVTVVAEAANVLTFGNHFERLMGLALQGSEAIFLGLDFGVVLRVLLTQNTLNFGIMPVEPGLDCSFHVAEGVSGITAHHVVTGDFYEAEHVFGVFKKVGVEAIDVVVSDMAEAVGKLLVEPLVEHGPLETGEHELDEVFRKAALVFGAVEFGSGELVGVKNFILGHDLIPYAA